MIALLLLISLVGGYNIIGQKDKDLEVNWKKKILSKIADFFFFFELYYFFLKLFKKNQYIRVINYHGVECSEEFARQVEFYSKWYVGVGLDELKEFLEMGLWKKSSPGLIISFDDGLINSKENTISIMEKCGFTGWFFIPTSFVSIEESKQVEFAKKNSILFGKPSSKLAMSWQDIKDLDQKHVIGSHTQNHVRLKKELGEETLVKEIKESKQILEEALGHSVETFCWVGGEEDSYSRKAALQILESGYKFSFMTNSQILTPRTDPLQIQRTNIESNWDLSLTKFQLCGFMDMLYLRKRSRVNRLTKVSQS